MMTNRFLATLCLGAVSLSTFSSINRTEGYMGVQQDMIDQVEEAQQNLKDGQPMMALAHANLVLIDHPLAVYVDFDHVNRRQVRDCEKAVDAAMDMWNKGLDEGRQFERTTDESQADIRLRFKPDVYDGGVPVGGLVTWRRAIHYVENEPTDSTTADVQVRVRIPRGGNMSFELMRHEASHELGHVLGLEDSPRMGDIMSPLDLRHPVSKISDFEIDAIKHIREAAHEVKDEVLMAYSTGV